MKRVLKSNKEARNSLPILHNVKANWQDPLFGGMVMASLLGLIYVFTRG
jgi:hypothetical protein